MLPEIVFSIIVNLFCVKVLNFINILNSLVFFLICFNFTEVFFSKHENNFSFVCFYLNVYTNFRCFETAIKKLAFKNKCL